MKRTLREVVVDVLVALGLGLAIWISSLGRPRYTETRPQR